MSVQYILGRAGSGKTHYCLEQIRQQLINEPSGHPIILLVPEQATFQAEYALVTTPGLSGIMRAQVLSFRRLAYRVMQETGGMARTPIDEIGKSMLLFKILHKRRDELRMFRYSVDQSGFIDQLNEWFSELKRYRITPSDFSHHFEQHQAFFSEQSHLLLDKLHDLLLVYQDFEQMLASDYMDAEDILQLLADQIQHSVYLKQAEIWIDGFHGFTPQELKVIEQLLNVSQKVHISLCLDRAYSAEDIPNEFDLFYPTAQTMIQLEQCVARAGVAHEKTVFLNQHHLPRFQSSPMLGYIEKHFHHRVKSDSDMPSNISIHAAVHRKAEVDYMARKMMELVRDQGYRWRDLAVLVRNIDDYHDLIRTTFSSLDIPYFFDQKFSVVQHPLVEFIRSALEVVRFNWRYESVFRCVKTDFILPLQQSKETNRQALDELENYVLAFGIQGEKWTDPQPWTYQHLRSLEDEPEQSEEQQVWLQNIHQTRQLVVRPLYAFQKKLRQAENVQDYVTALYELLETVQAAERLEKWSVEAAELGQLEKAKEHAQIWNQVMDMLDQMVELIGDERMTLELFCGMIETGLDQLKLSLVPPSLDQVLIGSMDRTRSSHIKHCFVLGVNDGIIPAQRKEDGILTERERECLMETGLEMAPTHRRKLLDEQFLIYTALTTPSDHLWLSYALADEEGKSLLPSEIIKRILYMFPTLETRLILAEPESAVKQQDHNSQLDYIAHPKQAMSYLISQLRNWKKGYEIDSVWWELYNWYCSQPQWRDLLKRSLYGLFYRNEEKTLSESTSRLLYGDHLKASVSRLEKYAACPFSQFISHGLRLKERQIYRLEAPDIGQLFHAALSQMSAQINRQQMNWGELTAEQWQKFAEQAVDQLAPRLQNAILLSSERHQYISRKLKKIVGKASVVLGEHVRRGHFQPIAFELGFGKGEPLPPLVFPLENGVTMEIGGRIDRVDLAEHDHGCWLRIIDYKSSQTSLGLTEVYYGLSLQLLTYLDVVVSHADRWLGKPALPAGAFYFHVHHPVIKKKNAISVESAEKDMFRRYKMKGIVLADREVVRLMDRGLEQGYSEIIPVAIKADGSFYKHSSVATDQQWERLKNHVRHVIRQFGVGVTSGDVRIQPYRLGHKTPCTFCSYRPICQFDSLQEGNQYNELRKQEPEQLWELMAQKGEGQ